MLGVILVNPRGECRMNHAIESECRFGSITNNFALPENDRSLSGGAGKGRSGLIGPGVGVSACFFAMG